MDFNPTWADYYPKFQFLQDLLEDMRFGDTWRDLKGSSLMDEAFIKLNLLIQKWDKEGHGLKRYVFETFRRTCLLYTSPSPRDRG